VPIAWIVRRVCVGDCRLCACSVCVCVCVCVCVSCASTCVPCFPPRDRAAWPGGGCCRSTFRPARTHRRTVNATVRPVCCPASLAAVHACAQSCAVQGGSSQRACVVKPLTCVCDCASWLRPAAACVWVGCVNVNTTDATAGATALLLPAQNTYTSVSRVSGADCSDYRRRSLGALYVCITGKAAVCE
jgi:hypothetical protein